MKKKYTKYEIFDEVSETMIHFFENNGWEKYNTTEESGKIVVDSMMSVVLGAIHHCIVQAGKSRKHSDEENFMLLEELMKDTVKEWIELEKECIEFTEKRNFIVKNKDKGTKH